MRTPLNRCFRRIVTVLREVSAGGEPVTARHGRTSSPRQPSDLSSRLVLAVSMFPQISIVTPLYEVLNDLHLLDTYRALSGAYTGPALPLMVYILWGHFRAIPAELDEAARIDGAGTLRILWSVIIPVTLPGVVPAALPGFIASWNELLLALSFTTSPAHQTIPVGIANFTALYSVPWADMAAAPVVVTLPLVVLVLIFQRRIVEGVTAGSVKG